MFSPATRLCLFSPAAAHLFRGQWLRVEPRAAALSLCPVTAEVESRTLRQDEVRCIFGTVSLTGMAWELEHNLQNMPGNEMFLFLFQCSHPLVGVKSLQPHSTEPCGGTPSPQQLSLQGLSFGSRLRQEALPGERSSVHVPVCDTLST